MKKFFTILGIVCLVVSIGLYMKPSETMKVSEGNLEQCEEFNSKDYFLTGGSKKPGTIEEINQEMLRLKWLCDGGSNQG